MSLDRKAHRVASARHKIKPLGEDLYAAIESTREQPVDPLDYACHLLALPIDTILTNAQISEAAEIGMGHMFTGGEKIK